MPIGTAACRGVFGSTEGAGEGETSSASLTSGVKRTRLMELGDVIADMGGGVGEVGFISSARLRRFGRKTG